MRGTKAKEENERLRCEKKVQMILRGEIRCMTGGK